MNKITSKSNVLFDINEIGKILSIKPRLNVKELTTFINKQKRAFKKYYNSIIKHKLGRGV